VTQLNPRGTGVGVAFIIFAVAPGAPIPRVGAFYHPPRGKRRKAPAALRAFFHRDPPAGAMLGEPGLPVVIVILAIPKDDREPRKVLSTDQREEVARGGALIQRGARNPNDEQQANSIDSHMPFPSFAFLPPVIPALGAPDFCRLDRLTVDTHRTGGRFAASLHTDTGAQHSPNLGPRPLIAPLREVLLHCTVWEQIVWSHLPLASGTVLIP
jgi:hypothetical protein